MTGAMTPLPYRVTGRRVETTDTVTLSLEPVSAGIGPWQPGQFTMAYAFGVGEIPTSISGGEGDQIRHTVRAVGGGRRARPPKTPRLVPLRAGDGAVLDLSRLAVRAPIVLRERDLRLCQRRLRPSYRED